MASAFQVLISILLVQTYAHGKENATKETTNLKILNPTLADLDDKNITNTRKNIDKSKEAININNHQDDQEQRQKRAYNFNGFQPVLPVYPTYASRIDTLINDAYGQEDPLVQIHKRLSDIAAIVRQSTMPPVPPATRYPIILPLLYPLPNSNCGCTPGRDKRPTQPNTIQLKPTQTKPTLPSTNITSRGTEMLDGENTSFIEGEEDFSRPISFDPIPPVEGIKRQPPPVEHGSVQGEISSLNSVQSTATSTPLVNRNTTPNVPTLSTTTLPTSDLPTPCDRAIISCCHQVPITYNCFATQGCPDPLYNAKPCSTAGILRAIDRLQRFYTQRNNQP